MRAPPFTFRSAEADRDSVVMVAVTAAAGGNWYVERLDDGWEQTADPARSPSATVAVDQGTAWKLVTKHRGRDEIRQRFPGVGSPATRRSACTPSTRFR